jgi:hypothetical protein
MTLSSSKAHFDQLFQQVFAGQLALVSVVDPRPEEQGPPTSR